MKEELLKKIKNIDKKTWKLIRIGGIVSKIIAVIGIIILYIYNKYYISYDLYLAGLAVFRTGIIVQVAAIVCGLGINEIKEKNR